MLRLTNKEEEGWGGGVVEILAETLRDKTMDNIYTLTLIMNILPFYDKCYWFGHYKFLTKLSKFSRSIQLFLSQQIR